MRLQSRPRHPIRVRDDCNRGSCPCHEKRGQPTQRLVQPAMFSAAQNDEAKVETALRTSASLAPNWFKPHWALAELLALTGRGAEARTEAEETFLLDAGKDPEVTQPLGIVTQSRGKSRL